MPTTLISENQSGFLKGRLITENVQLAQEIVQDIKKKNIGGNMVMKLDMAKAYDRMSWPFLMAVLRRFGFNENYRNDWKTNIWSVVFYISKWYEKWIFHIITGSQAGRSFVPFFVHHWFRGLCLDF